MNHALAQFFGAGLSLRLEKRASVGRTVIFENQRVIYGDVCRTLFKVAYRIAARGHYVAQQLVGIRYCASGTVNEPRLDSAPRFDKPRTITRSELPDV
jgi:hypothetical protein